MNNAIRNHVKIIIIVIEKHGNNVDIINITIEDSKDGDELLCSTFHHIFISRTNLKFKNNF